MVFYCTCRVDMFAMFHVICALLSCCGTYLNLYSCVCFGDEFVKLAPYLLMSI
jgi:hypothetical protein